jgi:hypothetical protein
MIGCNWTMTVYYWMFSGTRRLENKLKKDDCLIILRVGLWSQGFTFVFHEWLPQIFLLYHIAITFWHLKYRLPNTCVMRRLNEKMRASWLVVLLSRELQHNIANGSFPNLTLIWSERVWMGAWLTSYPGGLVGEMPALLTTASPHAPKMQVSVMSHRPAGTPRRISSFILTALPMPAAEIGSRVMCSNDLSWAFLLLNFLKVWRWRSEFGSQDTKLLALGHHKSGMNIHCSLLANIIC